LPIVEPAVSAGSTSGGLGKLDILRAVAAGERVAERDFDLIFPPLVRKLARTHWTPLAAALRATALLAEKPGARVLDVGSGAGKLCLVGALTTTGSFTGIEKDAELVNVARQIVRQHGVQRIRYVEGDALAADWTAFDAIYLFNPFANDVGVVGDKLTNRSVREEDFIRLVRTTEEKLAALRPGTRVVTYHGFGGTMPAGMIEHHAEVVGPGVLQVWARE
jgi:SAM-dependent methyltransferase